MAYNPCGTDAGALVLNDELLKNVFERNERILGKAVFAAKCSVIARYPTNDNYYGPAVLYTLFGDPALRIKRPGVTGLAAPRAPQPTPLILLTPNPLTGESRIRYWLPHAGNVSLKLYDVTGQLVQTLAKGYASAGASSLKLQASSLARGVYVLKLETEDYRSTKKLILE